MRTTLKPHEFTRRAIEVYQSETGSPTKHGWIRWFADQVRKDPQTVYRWKEGKFGVDPTAIVILETLERRQRRRKARR